MSAFALQLAELPAGHSEIRLEAPAAAAGLDEEVWPFPLQLTLSVDRRGDRLAFRGTGETRTREECPRCLAEFEAPVTFEFTAYAERSDSTRGVTRDTDNDGVIVHDGRMIVLDEQVRDQAILARPMLSYCRPDCAGLCPRCGADRNLGPCRCDAAAAGSAGG